MIDNLSLQMALRARALTLSVVSTGSITLSATATGYARTTGSFLTDGFAAGMEVTPFGFASNPVSTITAISDLSMTVDARAVESAASGRGLTVGLPLNRGWENTRPLNDPVIQGRPYVTEQYIPGPTAQVTIGPSGDIEMRPMYALHIMVPDENGIGAASRYADAVMRLFTPRTAIPVGTDTLRVRTDVGPFRGQLLQNDNGFAAVPVTIPLWLRTSNTI